MSIVLARSRSAAVEGVGPTMEPAADGERSTLEGVLSQVGARAHFLVEGTLVVTLPTRGSAQDQATLAARTALLLRDRLPDTRMIVLTGRGTRERTQVVGNLVELGMRLLASEPADAVSRGILLDPLSSQLLPPRFRTDRVAERSYLHSEDVDADETRLLLGRPTPCVGREVELTSLETALETCIEERERQIVLISGAAGQGKSRLRHEFLRRLSQSGCECTILTLRGEPTAAPYSVLRHALRHHSRIAESAPREVQLAQLRAHLPCGPAPPPRLLDFLAELLGVPGVPLDPPARRAAEQDPRLMRDQLRWAFAELLRETSQRLPLLLVLDDLQWCDAATLDLIDHAALALQDSPLFILALGRPEPAAAQHDLFRAHRPRSLQLGRLGRRSCERLVRQVLSIVNPALLSDERIRRLVDQSSGNALLLEELIRASVESPEDDRPQTVLAMLQARLGVLETAERHALLLASVLGTQFSARDLMALQGDELRASLVQTQLQALKEAELIEVQTERTDSADLAEFVFRNELIRQAAYELISADERAALHRRVARHLESAHPSAALRIGSHWLSAEEKDPAIAWLCRAAEQALDGHDLQETLRIAEVAIAAGAAGETLGGLWALQAAAAFWQGSYQQCQRWALAALPLIRRGSELFFRVLADAFIASSRIGDQAAVESLQGEALSIDAHAGGSDEGLICLARMSFHFLISLDFRRADLLLGRLGEQLPAKGSQAPLVRAQVAHAMGMRAAVRGDMAGYAEKLVEVLAAFDEAGDMRNACIETTTLAISLLQLGQSAEAERLCRGNVARCEQLRANQATLYTKLTLGLILTRREHELAEARQLLAGVIEEYKSIGHQRRVGLGHGYLALLLLCEGNLVQAEQEAQLAASHLADAGGFQLWALALHADVLLRLGRPAEALPLAQSAADGLSQAGGAPLMELLPFVVLGEILCALAQPEAAQRIVTLACERLRARLAQIASPAWRAGYLALPEQRRLRHLAQALCPDELTGELRDPAFLHDTPIP